MLIEPASALEESIAALSPGHRELYVVGTGPRIQGMLAQLTPTPARDALLRTATGVPRRR